MAEQMEAMSAAASRLCESILRQYKNMNHGLVEYEMERQAILENCPSAIWEATSKRTSARSDPTSAAASRLERLDAAWHEAASHWAAVRILLAGLNSYDRQLVEMFYFQNDKKIFCNNALQRRSK